MFKGVTSLSVTHKKTKKKCWVVFRRGFFEGVGFKVGVIILPQKMELKIGFRQAEDGQKSLGAWMVEWVGSLTQGSGFESQSEQMADPQKKWVRNCIWCESRAKHITRVTFFEDT